MQENTAQNVNTSINQNELFLVDASGFIFRAYHALPPLTRSDGMPVNAVLGFTNMLVRLIDEMKVKHIGVIFDSKRKNFRNDIYQAYKANRTETPEDLIPQFALIREATEAFSLPPIEAEGFEADDLIATYARLARSEGLNVTIVSSDKDLMQLMRAGVRLYDPMKYKFMSDDDVMDKFGVTPDKVVDVQALAGDATDNVPGVPGIGVKTAAQLINEYGSLEDLLNHCQDIKQEKRRQSLIENAEMARISKKLVMLDDEAPIPIALKDLGLDTFDSLKLLEFLQKQEFKSLITRISGKIGKIDNRKNDVTPIQQKEKQQAPFGSYQLITTLEALEEWIRQAKTKNVIAIDTETTSLTPMAAELVGISIAIAEGEACYIPLSHRTSEGLDLNGSSITQLAPEVVLSHLKDILSDPSIIKVGHNIKYDLQMFLKHDLNVTPIDDTMLMSYILNGTSHGHGMDELSDIYLAHKPIPYQEVVGTGKYQVTFDLVPLEKACAYAAEDADVTLRLYHLFKPRLFTEKMTGAYETLERHLAPVIAAMEMAGIKIDVNILMQLSQDFAKTLMVLEREIHALAGQSFNIASPKQMGDILFDVLKLPHGAKTKTGAWSTSADVLENLADEGHEIVIKILEWRQLAKLKSTYTDALPHAINPKTKRIHTSFSMVGTSTGRLSSSDPNLQNIPIKSEQGRTIRKAFIAEEGCALLSADYSQVELRLAAAMADIKALKQAFTDGVDIHTATAAQVFGIPHHEVTAEIRRSAKAINFGIIYGISGFGLGKQLGCSTQEASQYIKTYMARFPELYQFMEKCKEFARKHGYVETFYGRKCTIKGIHDKNPALRNFAERQAINAPLQGTSADIMKRAMIDIQRLLKTENFKTKMLLQVHDELVFEVPEAEKEIIKPLIIAKMQNAGREIDVPLLVEAHYAQNWAEAH
jgi:DNA polymerase-1